MPKHGKLYEHTLNTVSKCVVSEQLHGCSASSSTGSSGERWGSQTLERTHQCYSVHSRRYMSNRRCFFLYSVDDAVAACLFTHTKCIYLPHESLSIFLQPTPPSITICCQQFAMHAVVGGILCVHKSEPEADQYERIESSYGATPEDKQRVKEGIFTTESFAAID